jgi:hypothetical protein
MKKILLSLLLISTFISAADWPHKNISVAEFATDVVDRKPVNVLTESNNSNKKIFFYTNIRNLQGQTVKHRWSYQDKIMAEVSFNISGPRWRVWSSKNFLKSWTGEWKVDVISNGAILTSKTFNYKEK